MPAFFYQPISRKSFIRKSATLVGALSLGVNYFKATAAPKKEAHFALLSDTHIAADQENQYRGFFPYENLSQVIPQVQKVKPDGVIINGDVARLTGESADYQNVRRLLDPLAREVPVYMGMGNHDDRKHFLEVFPSDDQAPVQDKHISIIDSTPVRIILLDSLLYVDKVAGLLGKQQREWLDQYLGTSGTRPTVLFVHHTLGDGDTDLLDAGRMFDVIRPYKQVKAVFYGHSHRYHIEEADGLQLINLPAVGYNFNDEQPTGWVDALFDESGVKLTLHANGGNMAENGQTREISWMR
jgi:3',5'-cyclic AMP phosphodiesterase CpdA